MNDQRTLTGSLDFGYAGVDPSHPPLTGVPPAELVAAADVAFSLGRLTLTREILNLAVAWYPDDPEVLRTQALFGPPVVRVVPSAHPPEALARSRAWLRENSAAFREQWVAVLDGVLLGAGTDLDAVLLEAGTDHLPSGTIFTRIS